MYQKWRKGYFLLEQDKALAMPSTAKTCVVLVDYILLKLTNKKGS